jgi:hypothetical protein
VEQSEGDLAERGLLGGYRTAVGWRTGLEPGAARDQSYRLLALGTPRTPPRPDPSSAEAGSTERRQHPTTP